MALFFGFQQKCSLSLSLSLSLFPFVYFPVSLSFSGCMSLSLSLSLPDTAYILLLLSHNPQTGLFSGYVCQSWLLLVAFNTFQLNLVNTYL